MRRLLVSGLLLAALLQFGQAGWIHAKAVLAGWLLERAWSAGSRQDEPVRPWPWADTWPVARLRVPALSVEQIVLAGDSGRTLAFGPGLSPAGARPGEPGTSLISGHRDTHFRFLKKLRPGDMILLSTGKVPLRYRVRETRIVDSRNTRLLRNDSGQRLVLSTCYPFDALLPGGFLRYLVIAVRRPLLQRNRKTRGIDDHL